MTPPDLPTVPWNIFQWVVTIFGAVLAWMFRRHLKDDDDRFKAQESRISLLHAENIATIQTLRGDLLAGQSGLSSQFAAVRRTLDDVLLQQRGHK